MNLSKNVIGDARQEAPEGAIILEQADDHAHICAKLAERYKSDPVLFAALTDAAAIIRDLAQMGELAGAPENIRALSVDDFVATFRCEDKGVVGKTAAKIHSVSQHDDGIIEVVIDHWPQ